MSPEDKAPAAPAEPAVSTARQKFNCPACGAEAHWNPAKQALICPFCGTESPARACRHAAPTRSSSSTISLAALSRHSAGRRCGWQAAKTSVRCQSCQAISVFDAGKVGQRCEFCGSAQLVPYEQVADAFRPESLLPFKVSEPQARELRSRLVRPPMACAEQARHEGAHRHGSRRLPAVLDVRRARARALDGGLRRVLLRRVRQEPAAARQVDAGLRRTCRTSSTTSWCRRRRVCTRSLLRGVEPFPTDTLIPYDPGYLAGWTVERYQIDLPNAAAEAKRADERHARAAVRQPGAGRHPSQPGRATRPSAAERFKHVLVPVWLVTYDYTRSRIRWWPTA